MSEKIIGYILLLCGVAIILGSGVNIFQIATRKVAPINIFEFDGVVINTGDLVQDQVQTVQLDGLTSNQEEIVKALDEFQSSDSVGSDIEVVPGDVLTQTSNLFAHLILVGFLASVGYKIASLGVLMLRPIVVKLKQKNYGAQETETA